MNQLDQLDNFGNAEVRYLMKTFRSPHSNQAADCMAMVADHCHVHDHHPEMRNVSNAVIESRSSRYARPRSMKRANTSPTVTAEQIKAAIAAAPEHVHDPDAPSDPSDPKSVAEYFKDAFVVHGGGHQAARAALAAKRKPGQRGPRPKAPRWRRATPA